MVKNHREKRAEQMICIVADGPSPLFGCISKRYMQFRAINLPIGSLPTSPILCRGILICLHIFSQLNFLSFALFYEKLHCNSCNYVELFDFVVWYSNLAMHLCCLVDFFHKLLAFSLATFCIEHLGQALLYTRFYWTFEA